MGMVRLSSIEFTGCEIAMIQEWGTTCSLTIVKLEKSDTEKGKFVSRKTYLKNMNAISEPGLEGIKFICMQNQLPLQCRSPKTKTTLVARWAARCFFIYFMSCTDSS